MVRVLSCYNFQSQDVFTASTECTAACSSSSNIFLALDGDSSIGRCQHVIEVRDLNDSHKVAHTFPTVSKVIQMLHCHRGNYLCSIEVKSTNTNSVTFARVYLQWEYAENTYPTKVRVAGHGLEQRNVEKWPELEIIEIALEQCPTCVACCQRTGNLCVGVEQSVYIYTFSTHRDGNGADLTDFSKLIKITFNFPIQHVGLCENYLAALSVSEAHVVKISLEQRNLSRRRSDAFSSSSNNMGILPHSSDDDGGRVTKEPNRDDSYVISHDFLLWDFDDLNYPEEYVSIAAEKKSFPSENLPKTVCLEAIERENSYIDISNEPKEVLGPISKLAGHEIEITALSKKLLNNSITYSVTSMLYKRMAVTYMDTALHSLHLYPVYRESKEILSEQDNNIEDFHNTLKSSQFDQLTSVSFSFSSSTEFYIYEVHELPNLLQTSPFMSNCISMSMNRQMLYAHTISGIETYTNRAVYSALCKDIDYIREENTPTCLVGLHSFSHVNISGCNEIFVWLLSGNEEDGSSTIYILTCPSVDGLYVDMEVLAKHYKLDSPPIYHHLLYEGHILLLEEITTNYSEHFNKLYQQSCLLLADYYGRPNSKCRKLTVTLYLRSGVSVEEILLRAILQKPPDSNYGHGLLEYLLHVMCSKSDPAVEKIDCDLEESSSNSLLELFVGHNNLPLLIISSRLKNYDPRYAIGLVEKQIDDMRDVWLSKDKRGGVMVLATHHIALAYMHLTLHGDDEMASIYLSHVNDDVLLELDSTYPTLFISWTNSKYHLTDLCLLLRKQREEMFANLLLSQLNRSNITLTSLVSIIDHNQSLMQGIMEEILTNIKWHNWFSEAGMFLVDILLNKLVSSKGSISDTPPILPLGILSLKKPSSSLRKPVIHRHLPKCVRGHYGVRHVWLNEVKPFKGDKLFEKPCEYHKLYLHLTSTTAKPCLSCCCCNTTLIKLQSILCYKHANDELAKYLMGRMLASEFRGRESVHLLCLMKSDEMEAVNFVLSHFPHILRDVCNEMFQEDVTKWKRAFDITLQWLNCKVTTSTSPSTYKPFTDILSVLCEHLDTKEFLTVLPKHGSFSFYVPYIKRNCQIQSAKTILSQIAEKGKCML